MKKIRKMDELEMSVNLQALRWSWGITALMQVCWLIFDAVKYGFAKATESPLWIIFLVQVLSCVLITLILKSRITNEK